MNFIEKDKKLQRKEDQMFSEIDDEVVMLSIENNEYIGLNKVASKIWKLLENPLSFQELVEKLMVEYDVSEEICSLDTEDLIKKLLEKKLICYV